ncbi:hypothetical protein NEOLEDRAFT_358827 [Neolentinus lepideus HHB14362 ss-1]|uniref:Aminoglycoside phosphotransferase domain-containing protein n=1 Tax=Neolentinus lepideus HHB14362 ss-1 TaxID=1314782 RepID=A0A165SM85_9AGAM|nr:hypothetical protein NEOLEDRAFT_358827 [Neolentinus lepideus HHB14362 ss-1]
MNEEVMASLLPAALQNEPSFHSKTMLWMSSLPVRSKSLLGSIWRSFPQSVRMTVYRLLLWMGRRLYWNARYPEVQRLPFGLYCKFGWRASKDEALATMFVAENTTIPVPRILDVIGPDDNLFILMTRVGGHQVLNSLSEMVHDSLALFEADLRDCLYQLRSLVPLLDAVSSFTDLESMQWRIDTSDPIGPFVNKDDLHEHILSCAMDRASVEPVALQKSYSKPHRICFTHGDLTPYNVLVSNGRLSGLVDWGSSG